MFSGPILKRLKDIVKTATVIKLCILEEEKS